MSDLTRLPCLPGRWLYRHSRGDHTRATAWSALGWDEREVGRVVLPPRRGGLLTSAHSSCGWLLGYWALSPAQPGKRETQHLMGAWGCGRTSSHGSLVFLHRQDILWKWGCAFLGMGAGWGVSHQGGAHLDDEPRGHGGQVLLQSQFEIFINLIWNQDRQNTELRCFLGRVEGSMG